MHAAEGLHSSTQSEDNFSTFVPFMQSSYIPVTGIPIPTDQNASKYFFVTFLRLLTRNLIPGLSLVLYLDNRRERIN